MDKQQSWKTYEEVAQALLNDIAYEFGLGAVEGKQIVAGNSGTDWEIDGKGLCDDGEGFVIIECRRHTKAGLSQEAVGGVAYRITDTNASGAIVVSPLDLQSGAKKVAAHEKITHVKLAEDSSTTEYMMEFLNRMFFGFADSVKVGFSESLTIKGFEKGELVDRRELP